MVWINWFSNGYALANELFLRVWERKCRYKVRFLQLRDVDSWEGEEAWPSLID